MKFTKILFVIIVATMFFSGNKITKATSGHCTNWSEVNDLVAEVQFHNSCGYDDFAVSVNGVNLENTSGTTVTAGQSSILVGADLCNTCNSAASGIGAFITTVTFNGSTQQLTNYSGSGSGYGTYWLNMPTTPGSYNIVFKNWMSGSPSYVGTTTIPVTIVAAPINGACSPSHYNCSTGTSTNNVAGASSWTWTCAGLNGGTNAPCSEIKPVSTVNVSSNISSASWTITGPATLTGTGISKSYTSQPAGTYTITWGAVSGYTTPTQQSLTLTAGGTITFTGTYTAISVVVNGACTSPHYSCSAGTSIKNVENPLNWTWTCQGSGGGINGDCGEPNSPICASTHYNCTLGSSISNAENASSWTWFCDNPTGFVPSASCSETKPVVNTINVSSNISSASWTITGPATLTGTGISKSYTSQPAGTYTITWNDVAGYKNPGTDNQSLIAGGTINFSGNYMACVYTCGSTLPSCPTTVGSLYCLDSCTGGYTLQSNCTSCPTPTTITCSALTPGTWKEVAP